MPNILFASNNIVHFPNSIAGSVAGTYDATRVPYAIVAELREQLNSPVFKPSTGNETWFHFRFFNPSSNVNFDNANQDVFFTAFDADGRQLFKISKRTGQSQILTTLTLYDGATTTATSDLIQMTINKNNTIDIRYYSDELGITCDYYINGALAATRSFASNPNAYGDPVSFTFSNPFVPITFTTNKGFFSEFIVADGDTRNARLNLLRPAAAGAYDDWIGSLNTLADDDPTSGITTIAANEKQTMTLSAYSGAANISNFVSVSTTTRGQNSPTGLKHLIRMSTVDYESAVIPVGFPLQYNLTDFAINPATSLPWVASDLIGIETGFISVA